MMMISHKVKNQGNTEKGKIRKSKKKMRKDEKNEKNKGNWKKFFRKKMNLKKGKKKIKI